MTSPRVGWAPGLGFVASGGEHPITFATRAHYLRPRPVEWSVCQVSEVRCTPRPPPALTRLRADLRPCPRAGSDACYKKSLRFAHQRSPTDLSQRRSRLVANGPCKNEGRVAEPVGFTGFFSRFTSKPPCFPVPKPCRYSSYSRPLRVLLSVEHDGSSTCRARLSLLRA